MQAELAATHPLRFDLYGFSEAHEQLTSFKIDSATGECEGGSFGPMIDLYYLMLNQAIYQTTHPSRIVQFSEFLSDTLTL